MLTVWGRTTSFNVQKVMWTIGELGLEHRRIEAGGAYGGLNSPEYLAMNPNGKIPVIDDSGVWVWESNAIVRYLAGRYGAGTLCPDNLGARAAADQWMDWMLTTLYPDWIATFYGMVRTPPSKRDPQALAASVALTAKHYGLLDAHLAQSAYVAGDRLTMGDIPIGSTLHRYFDMEIERPRLANLEAYYARLKERPAFRDHAMVSYESLRVTDEVHGLGG